MPKHPASPAGKRGSPQKRLFFKKFDNFPIYGYNFIIVSGFFPKKENFFKIF